MDKKQLQIILDEHKKWLETDGKEGRCANLSQQDLSHQDLEGVNLSHANLSHTNLSYANLNNATLAHTNFDGAVLCHTYFVKSKLIGAKMNCADLTNAELQFANLFEASLTKSKLTNANFRWANLCNANLRCSNLPSAYFLDTDFRFADIDLLINPLLSDAPPTFEIDDGQATQILYHLLRNVQKSSNTSAELKDLLNDATLIAQANKFYRVNEYGLLSSVTPNTADKQNVFPVITKDWQKAFELEQEELGRCDITPSICGYFGRACRRMNNAEGANGNGCLFCPLAKFVENKKKEGNQQMKYLDKNGNEIKAGMTILMEDGSTETVYETVDEYGRHDLGINASNEVYLQRHPDEDREYYPLSNFNTQRIEICQTENNEVVLEKWKQNGDIVELIYSDGDVVYVTDNDFTSNFFIILDADKSTVLRDFAIKEKA